MAGGLIMDKDEEEERKRRDKERSKLGFIDRLHRKAPRTTDTGFRDGRSKKRTGRVIPILVRVHPRVRAMLDFIMERDGVPSMVTLLEEMVEAYCKVHGEVQRSELPSDDELLQRYEKGQDDADAR